MVSFQSEARSLPGSGRRALGAFISDLACLSVAGNAMWLGWQKGGVFSNSQLVSLDLLCISLPLFLVGLLLRAGDRQRSSVPLAGIVLLGLLAWGVIQTSALWKSPPEFVREFALDVTQTDAQSRGFPWGDHAISVAPASSRLTCTHWAMVTAAFLMAANSFGSLRRRRWLWGAVAINAIVLAAVGLGGRFMDLQSAVWQRSIFSFGPFYNRNNSIVWLILGMAAVWALLVLEWRRADEESVFNRDDNDAGRWGGFGQLLEQAQDFVVSLRPLMIVLIMAAVLIFTGACSSLSRAGIVSLTLATAAPLFLRPRRLKVGRILGVYGIIAGGGIALGALFYVFQGIEGRLANAPMQEVLTEPLFRHWEDSLDAIQSALPWGSGPGTYRYAYLPFQSRAPQGWFHHAENQYLELLLEGGLLAAGLFVLLLISAIVTVRRHLKSWSSDDFDVAIAGVIVLVGISAQAIFDFGTSLLPNALLIAVVTGMILGNGSTRPTSDQGGRFDLSRVWLPAALVCLLAMLFTNRPLLAHDVAIDALNDDVKSVLLVEKGIDERQIEPLLKRATRLAATFDDFRAEQMIGELNLLAFRNRLFRELSDPQRGLTEVEPGALWVSTSMLALCGMTSSDASAAQQILQRVHGDPVLIQHLDDARAALATAKASCPMLPKVDLSIAEIDTIRRQEDAGDWMLRAVKVAPTWPGQAFQAGLLAFMTDHKDIEHRAFQVAAQHTEAGLVRVAEFYARRGAFGEFVTSVLPDDPETSATLLRSERLTLSDLERQQLAGVILSSLGEPATKESEERHFARATAAKTVHQYALALAEYRNTLDLNPDRLAARLEYARCLVESGDCDSARVQLEMLKHCDDRSITTALPSLNSRLQSCKDGIVH